MTHKSRKRKKEKKLIKKLLPNRIRERCAYALEITKNSINIAVVTCDNWMVNRTTANNDVDDGSMEQPQQNKYV